jgi:lipoprotein-anchoring transpeptidase ErfK/SrfK
VQQHRYWVVAAIVLAVLAAFVAFEFVTAPRIQAVTPTPGASLARDSLVVSVHMPGAEHLHDLSVRLDDRDVTPIVRVDGQRLFFTTGRLAQGPHTVALRARTSNLLEPRVTKTWQFGVDTVPPVIRLTHLRNGAVVTTAPLSVNGTTEADATVAASAGSSRSQVTAASSGSFALNLEVSDGRTSVAVVATDAAGNTTTARRSLIVDAQPPTLTVDGIEKVERDDAPKASVIATDAAGTPMVKLRLDGQYILHQKATSQIKVPFDKLPEGLHSLVVTATDRGRNITAWSKKFLVNSTEKLGKATLIYGARGKDVKKLQRKLRQQGAYHGPLTGILDRATQRAVERFQAKIGITVDGVVGPMMLGGLTGRIVIVQHEHRLYFYLNGKLKKSYAVATGQPAWPTPNGQFSVVWMTMNPTWTPPDSPWAAGAKPVAPGPNNPVGMRWIGTSASGVGIHGVPSSEDWSIGTYASHGCIRMYEWDVEELYSWVTVGMPVIIQP